MRRDAHQMDDLHCIVQTKCEGMGNSPVNVRLLMTHLPPLTHAEHPCHVIWPVLRASGNPWLLPAGVGHIPHSLQLLIKETAWRHAVLDLD